MSASLWHKLENLSVPVIAAPMFMISNPAMAIACCSAGVVGTFPAHFPRSSAELAHWLDQLSDHYTANPDVPYAVNLVTHRTNKGFEADARLCSEKKVPIILSSKSAPGDFCKEVHSYGGLVFHDVACRRHAEKAVAAGVDALIAVANGAGGHTGTLNPFALVNEIRQVTDKPIILGGSITTGKDVLAAQVLGCKFSYMGTRFIATKEANATQPYKKSILNSLTGKDIIMTAALDGTPVNWMRQSLVDCGIDPSELEKLPKGEPYAGLDKIKGRYTEIFSAGHGVGVIDKVLPVSELVGQLEKEYNAAKQEILDTLL